MDHGIAPGSATKQAAQDVLYHRDFSSPGGFFGGFSAVFAARRLKPSQAYAFLAGAAAMILQAGIALILIRFPIAAYPVLLLSAMTVICFVTLFSVFALTLIQRLTPNHLPGRVVSPAAVFSTTASIPGPKPEHLQHLFPEGGRSSC